MKQFVLFSLIIIAILSLTGCGNNPKTIAREFLTSMEQHTYGSAAKYVSKDSQKTLEDLKRRFDALTTIERQDNPKRKYKITASEIVIKGESAKVIYQVTTTATNRSNNSEQPSTGELQLITENYKWKVVLEPGSGF